MVLSTSNLVGIINVGVDACGILSRWVSQKLVHCCSWLLTETQCKIISVQHVCRPKLFKNLCLSLVSGVSHFFFRTTPLAPIRRSTSRGWTHIVHCTSVDRSVLTQLLYVLRFVVDLLYNLFLQLCSSWQDFVTSRCLPAVTELLVVFNFFSLIFLFYVLVPWHPCSMLYWLNWFVSIFEPTLNIMSPRVVVWW